MMVPGAPREERCPENVGYLYDGQAQKAVRMGVLEGFVRTPEEWGCMGNALMCRFPLKAIGVLRATAFAKSVGLVQGHGSV